VPLLGKRFSGVFLLPSFVQIRPVFEKICPKMSSRHYNIANNKKLANYRVSARVAIHNMAKISPKRYQVAKNSFVPLWDHTLI